MKSFAQIAELVRHPFSRRNRKIYRENAMLKARRTVQGHAVAAAQVRADGVTQDLADSFQWWHTIDLGGGVVTRGFKSLESMREEAEILFGPVDLRGQSFLDVGAWNGGFSVEAARRGAARIAGLDHTTWNDPHLRGRETYELVGRATGHHFEMYDVDLDRPGLSLQHVGEFDIVLYSGVFYHLVDPIAATREVAGLARRVLVLETHVERAAGARPTMVFYPGDELNADPTNWWGPNAACVRALLRHFGFSRIDEARGSGRDRMVFHAYR